MRTPLLALVLLSVPFLPAAGATPDAEMPDICDGTARCAPSNPCQRDPELCETNVCERWPEVCDIDVDVCRDNPELCNPDVPVVIPELERNNDGSWSVYLVVCDSWGCSREHVYTTPSPPQNARVRQNADGSYSVVYTRCTGTTCTDVEAARTPPVLTCYTYNPDAITNLCLTTGTSSVPVTHPSVTPTTRNTCVIGQEVCSTHPWATVGSTTTPVPVPTVGGYVEATILCSLGVPCRLTLP